MKTHITLTIAAAALGFAGASKAQQCYTPVTSWQGEYSLSTSGSASSCTPGVSCSVQQAVTGTSAIAQVTVSNCSNFIWEGSDASQSVSIKDEYVNGSCPGGNYTTVVTQTGGIQGSSSAIHVSPSSGTFLYGSDDLANANQTESGCGLHLVTSIDVPMYPETNWPSFPLPATVETLSTAPYVFKAEEWVTGLTLPYTFTFTLTPIYDCKDCREDGTNSNLPVSSSIGPENGSLGEDLPIIGTPFKLHYESGRAPGAGKNAVATADASMLSGWTLNVHHAYDPATNTLFLGDGGQRAGYELGTPLRLSGNFLLTSEDGSQVYVFSGTSGAHLQTLRPITGALLYHFGYDSAGKRTTITDNAGNVTTIRRDAKEHPTAIASPYGQTTTVAVDANGFLSRVTDPLGKSATFSNTTTGLLLSRTDPNGNTFTYRYDALGRLARDADPLGGYVALARSQKQQREHRTSKRDSLKKRTRASRGFRGTATL